MKEFISENWLSIIGALAWLPFLINLFMNLFGRISFVYLDKHFIYNATANINQNGVTTQKNGMAFMMALNLSANNQSFFPRKISCTIILKNGAKHSSTLFVGDLGYSDNQVPSRKHLYIFPNEYDICLNRLIYANRDNVRVLPFFFESLNMQNDANIRKIVIEFKRRFFKKKISIQNDDCARHEFFSNFDKIIK